jgi:glycerol-3-phosphate dehydrogenase subunit B
VSLFGASGTSVVEATAADAAKSAASTLDGWLAPSGLRLAGGLESARLLANARGAVRVADLVLSGPAEGDLRGAREIAVADLRGLAHFDARPALRQMAAELAALGVPRPAFRVAPIAWPPGLATLAASPARLAARLDDPAAAAALAEALGAAARATGLDREGVLLLPPVVGITTTGSLLARLRDAVGLRVAELLGTTPVAPSGLRLDRALQAALVRVGVVVAPGRVARVEVSARRARAAHVETASGAFERVDVAALVLATGRFVGGGVAEREGRLVEPLFGLPLFDERDARVDGVSPRRLVRVVRDDPQSLLSSGVRVDDHLRPVGRDGAAAMDNVFAAGDVIGGFDPARDRTGLGVALLTGLRAGAEAAQAVRAS